MARDVNEFISEALKEGYGMEDVVGFMANHKNEDYRNWASNWVNTANSPEYKTGFADEQIGFEKGKEALKNQFEAKKKEATTTDVFGMNIPSVLTGPGAQLAGVALLGAGAGYGLSKLKDRSIKNPKVAEVVGDIVSETKIDPTFNPDPTKSSPASMIEKAQQRVEAGRAAGIGQTTVQGGAAPTATTSSVPPSMASQSVSQSPSSAVEAVKTGENLSKVIQTDVAKELDKAEGIRPRAELVSKFGQPSVETGSGIPAYAGSGPARQRGARGGVYESLAKVPAGQVFVPDMGPGTNTIRQAIGQDAYEQLVRQQGQAIGSDASARAMMKNIEANRVGPPITREMRKDIGVSPLPNTTGIPMKAVKVAGVLGSLIAATDAAKAASQGDTAPAKELAFDLGTSGGLAAILGGPAAAALLSAFGSSGLNKKEDVELAKRWRKGSSTPAKPTVD